MISPGKAPAAERAKRCSHSPLEAKAAKSPRLEDEPPDVVQNGVKHESPKQRTTKPFTNFSEISSLATSDDRSAVRTTSSSCSDESEASGPAPPHLQLMGSTANGEAPPLLDAQTLLGGHSLAHLNILASLNAAASLTSTPQGLLHHFQQLYSSGRLDKASSSEPGTTDMLLPPKSLSISTTAASTMITPLSPATLSPHHWLNKTSSTTSSPEESLASPIAAYPTGGGGTIYCVVCADKSSGKHYGCVTCEGCKSFFKRSVRRNLTYSCRGNKNCPVDQHHRNQCQACRFQKCIKAGMRKEAVQQGRIHTSHSAGSFPLLSVKPPSDAPASSTSTTVSTSSSSINSTISASSTTGFNGYVYNNMISSLLRADTASRAASSQLQSLAGLEQVCEVAARLLFSTVEWARTMSYFSELQLPDQILLIRTSWADMFTINAAQHSLPVHLAPLLVATGLSTNAIGADKMPGFMERVRSFQDQVDKLKKLNVDSAECSCLKAIALFNSDAPGLSEPAQVEAYQVKAQSALEEYEKSQHQSDALRFGRLLLRLPPLKSISPTILEHLFFTRLTGMTPVETLLRDLLIKGGGGTTAAAATSSEATH